MRVDWVPVGPSLLPVLSALAFIAVVVDMIRSRCARCA